MKNTKWLLITCVAAVMILLSITLVLASPNACRVRPASSTIHIYRGTTYFSLPIVPNQQYRASDICNNFNGIVAVDRFDAVTQGIVGYVCVINNPIYDFNIEPDYGYVVETQTSAPSIQFWRISGTTGGQRTINLNNPGLALVGWTSRHRSSVANALSSLGPIGGSWNDLIHVDPRTGAQTSYAGGAFNRMTSKHAYLLWINQPVTWSYCST